MARSLISPVVLTALLLAMPADAASTTVVDGRDTYYLTTDTTAGSCSTELSFHRVVVACEDDGDRVAYDSRRGCSNSAGSGSCILNVLDSPGSSNQLNCEGKNSQIGGRSYNISTGIGGSNICTTSEFGTSMTCENILRITLPGQEPTPGPTDTELVAADPPNLGVSRRAREDVQQPKSEAAMSTIAVSCAGGCGVSTGNACCCEVGVAGCGGGTKCNGS